jgi:hypothetical protein
VRDGCDRALNRNRTLTGISDEVPPHHVRLACELSDLAI